CLGYISDLGGAYNGGSMINYDVRPLNRTTQTNGEYWVHEGGFVYDGEKDIALSLWNQDRGKVWWDNISIYQVKRSLEGREDFQRYTADNFRSSLYAAGLIDNYTYVGTHIDREVESDGNVALRMKAKNGAIKAFHIKAKNHLGGVSAYKVNFRMKLLIPEGTQNAAETYTLGLYYTDGTSVYPQGIVVPTEQCKNKWFNVEVCFTEVNAGAPSMSIRQIDIATTPTAYAPDYLVDDISWGRMLISDMPRTKTIAYYTNFAAPQNGNTITWRISETTEASSFSTADTITSIGQFVPASAEDSAQMLTAIYRKDGEKMTLHKVTTSTFAAMTVTGKTDISLSGLAPGANYVLVNYLWDTDLKALIPDEVHHFAITETTA
ncbi:MAG: hypothetical protein PUB07_06030, partial [Clostridia bacterium]|nr:hypothetical protein [Clostridia bacterium]